MTPANESAIERVLGRELRWLDDPLTIYPSYEDCMIETLDASLEYWLMKHQADTRLRLGHWSQWDSEKGWQCDCI